MPEVIETLILLESPPWMEKAACADPQYDGDDWYPYPYRPYNAERTARAVKVCRQCPVRRECLQWGLETEDPWAVLGGQTARQRRDLLRKIRWQK